MDVSHLLVGNKTICGEVINIDLLSKDPRNPPFVEFQIETGQRSKYHPAYTDCWGCQHKEVWIYNLLDFIDQD